MDITSIGAAGMAAAIDRFSASAQRTAGGQGDLTAEIVRQAQDKEAFSASAAVARAGQDIGRRLLDIKV